MTMHPEISTRGSLIPAGDGSSLLSDTSPPGQGSEGGKSRPLNHMSNHAALYASLDHHLREAIQWFRKNGLMTNPRKFQLLVLGSTEQDFSFNIDGQQIKKCDIGSRLAQW